MQAPKVFFSHRHAQVKGRPQTIRQAIDDTVAELKDADGKLPFQPVFGERRAPETWKDEVAQIIQDCDLLVCVADAETAANPNITWELEQARQHGKAMVLARLDEAAETPDLCAAAGLKPVPLRANSLLGALLPHLMLNRGVKLGSETTRAELMAQYTLMTGSWEALINRRQSVNSFYSTVSATMLGGIGGCVVNYESLGKSAPLAVFCLSLLGWFLSSIWEQTIHSYGIASRSKSDVVCALETHLPAQVFDYEWKVMSIRRYVSTTQKDERTARYFSVAFLIMLALSVTVALWSLISHFSVTCTSTAGQ